MNLLLYILLAFINITIGGVLGMSIQEKETKKQIESLQTKGCLEEYNRYYGKNTEKKLRNLKTSLRS